MPRRRRSAGEDQDWVEERRACILGAAAAIFANRGYHRTRMQEIADKAGVAAGTLYNYFDSKEDLLVALLKEVAAGSVTTALNGKNPSGDPDSWLTALLSERVDTLDRNWHLIQAVTPELIAHERLRREYLDQVVLPLLEQLAPLFQDLAAGGHLRPFNPRVILPALAGAIIGAVAASEYSALEYKTVSRDDIVVELRALILDGLRQHQGSPAGITAEESRPLPHLR